MRYLVLTDIHANLEALDACLADARSRAATTQPLVLGDLVGYGPDPNAVVERVQALKPVAIVRGNHDKVACGLEQAEGFNSVAQERGALDAGMLTPEHRDWLAALPQGPHRRRRPRGDLPRLAVRRGRLHLRRARRGARAEGRRRGRCACSATRIIRSPSSCQPTRSNRRPGDRGEMRLMLRDGGRSTS